ncbi:MAG: NAD(P)-dependent oxidoreductase [Chloroflexi bacterium]|nr:NAD(P)-dependent oxidoreductase [Chloroflexota bacterium]
MAMRIGFIGLGLMGAPISRNLLKAGHQVVAWNRTASRLAALVRDGGMTASSPQEVAAQVEVTITMVTDSPDVEAVVLGSQGVLHGARPGSVVIDMSTISPSVTRSIAARLQKQGVHLLDAPVSGGVWGAQNASLSIMVGGEQEVFQRCLPVFQALGKRITYCGGHGMGQTVKLVNQIVVAGTLAAVSEGLLFAARAGADLEATLQAIGGGAAQSWQLENLGPRILKGDFAPGFMVKLQQKDLRLILDAAREMQLPLLTTPIVHQLYRAVEREGLGEEGTQAYIKALEKLAGVQARLPEKRP